MGYVSMWKKARPGLLTGSGCGVDQGKPFAVLTTETIAIQQNTVAALMFMLRAVCFL